jgi:hypothetical protein
LEIDKERGKETAAKMARQDAELLALIYDLNHLQSLVSDLRREGQGNHQTIVQAIEDLKSHVYKMMTTNGSQQATRKMTQATCLYHSQESNRGPSTDLQSTERVHLPQSPLLASPVSTSEKDRLVVFGNVERLVSRGNTAQYLWHSPSVVTPVQPSDTSEKGQLVMIRNAKGAVSSHNTTQSPHDECGH